MRARIALLALLTVAASRGHCGGTPSYDACDGKTCGETCRVCPLNDAQCVETAVLKACDPLGRCVAVVADLCAAPPPPPRQPDPCAGKACGEACEPCGGMCMHPYATACDLWGRCVPASSWICWDPCAGKACGADCHLCPADARDCAETLELKACDPSGRCVSRTPELVCPE